MLDQMAGEVVRDVVSRLDGYRENIRVSLKRLEPIGLIKVTDAEFRAFVELKMQEYPPQQWVLPDGRRMVGSAWMLMLALPNVAGGEGTLARYEKIVQGERT